MKHVAAVLLSLALISGGCQFGDIDIFVSFDQVSGLQKGDRVLFQGNPAGNVTAVVYNPNNTYQVNLSVDKGYAHALTEYSQFYLVADAGRNGHKAVDIRLTRQGGKKLGDGATVAGVSEPEDIFSKLQKDIAAGMALIEQQIEKFSRDITELPESEEYQELKKSLEEWAKEMGQAGEKARKQVEKQWLPKIEKELEALRQWLRDQGREEEIEPIEREIERIRNINI